MFLIYRPSSVDPLLMGAQRLRLKSHSPLCEHVNQPLGVSHVSLALLATHRCALLLQMLGSGDIPVLRLHCFFIEKFTALYTQYTVVLSIHLTLSHNVGVALLFMITAYIKCVL